METKSSQALAYWWRSGWGYGLACEKDAQMLAENAGLTWHLTALTRPDGSRPTYWAGYDDTDTQVFRADYEEEGPAPECDFCGVLLQCATIEHGAGVSN